MIKKYLPSIIFNIGEFLIIFLCGFLLKLDLRSVTIIVLSFIVAHLAIGKPKHYKAWQLCLLWTTLVFISLLIVGKADIILASLIAIFNALIVSGRADIKDMFQWTPRNESKYQKELDFVKYNPSAKSLIEFETMLKQEDDTLTYLCYKYIFKDGKSWQKTAEMLDTDTNRLTPIVDKLAFTIRIFCKI